ncbi:2'-hydroxyisoflavone reductase [Pseudomonas syringae]|uniref:2'-hydroxyisoflavone reductase n=1 Tax=Pseudomonas syringae TaxID=317 RepID=A0A1C7Z068_PSESX|nr:aromatic alcohol reductase [Pseudomonas syringae]OCR22397.1 2'-hydroxyisoflavone reductase [Pseudomonas syringae]
MQDDTRTTDRGILVLGAGELGMAVLRQLARLAALAGDTQVTVLLRPATIKSSAPDKQKEIDELRSLGIDLLPGDLVSGTIAELSALFASFDTVVSCIGFAAGKGTQIKLARAAIEAGVQRYVPWQFGVDYDVIGRGSAQDLFDEQLDVRDILRGQDATEWLIISTGMFTSFLFEPVFGVVDLAQNTVHALGSWDTAVTVTTPEDIGLLTAEILFANPRLAHQVIYTAGDTLTYGELADKIDKVLNRKVQRVEWPVAKLNADLALEPDDAIRKYRAVFAQGQGVAWDRGCTFNVRQGIEVTDVEHWMRLNLR